MRAPNYIKICTIALLLVTTGCQNTGRNKLNTTPGPSPESPAREVLKKLPDWFRAPEGWDRLDKIETWLETPAAKQSDWRNYARIELAEGCKRVSTERRK